MNKAINTLCSIMKKKSTDREGIDQIKWSL